VEGLAGLIFSGGPDITETDVAKDFSLRSRDREQRERDEFEIRLMRTAAAKGLPVLGICRGAQLINVALGGSLHPDIGPFYRRGRIPRSILPCKPVCITPNSHLSALLGQTQLRVNGLHHQAIRAPAPGLRITAQESNGVVQAVEHRRLPFVLGVQWHPELMLYRAAQRRIFSGLVAAAARRKG